MTDTKETEDNNIDMNALINTIACSTQSDSSVSSRKLKEPVLLTQETKKMALFLIDSTKSFASYPSKKKTLPPDDEDSDVNNYKVDRIFSDEEEDNTNFKEKSHKHAHLRPTFICGTLSRNYY